MKSEVVYIFNQERTTTCQIATETWLTKLSDALKSRDLSKLHSIKMANESTSSSSSSAPIPVDDEELLLTYGSESGWVEARTHCDHLGSLSSDLTHIPTPDTPCERFALFFSS